MDSATGYNIPINENAQILKITSENNLFKVYIDDVLVIDQWEPSAYHNSSVSRRLTAGLKYKIVIEYYQKGGDARVDFTWKKSGDTKDYLAEYLKYSRPCCGLLWNELYSGRRRT